MKKNKMKKDALIKIHSVYHQEDDSDSFEMITPGEYSMEDDKYMIAYNESELTGLDGVRTHLTIDKKGHRVILERTGASRTLFTIERGVRHQCCYDTGFGQMTIGVSGRRLLSALDETGGIVNFVYALDIDTVLQSTNEILIVVSTGEENADGDHKNDN